MTYPKTIATFSGLGKVHACRRLWWLSEYRRLHPAAEPITGPLPFGTRVHKALEMYYKDEVPDPLVAWIALMGHEYAVAAETGAFTDGLDKENKYGYPMMENYAEWTASTGEDAKYETLSVETAMSDVLTVPVWNGTKMIEVGVLIRGKSDRRVRRISDGAILIADFKTMGNFGEPAILSLQMSPQPRIYMELELAERPGSDVRGVLYTLLRKVQQSKTAKPPFYRLLEINISAVDMAAYRVRLTGAVQELAQITARLDAGEDPHQVAFFSPSWSCGTCPFKAPCQLFQHSTQAAEDMLADLYTVHDPFKRYAQGYGEDTEDTPKF
jgi:hypothetical protein